MLKKAMIVLLAAGAGVYVWFHFFVGEESKIRKQFESLAEWSSKETGENKFATANKVNNIKSLFADRVRLKAPGKTASETFGKEDISMIAMGFLGRHASVSTSCYNLGITLTGETAKVFLTASFSGELPNGEKVRDVHEFECDLEKFGEDWLFTAVEVVEDTEQ